ncbi:DEAD/DEAH box helicase family protein [Exiguobacterium sp. BRG2]|uniref:DEAD/DEAH box helicase n=1 Tax=Exiguobacterium sp. BRG2 TaxID=2962584 RepID=UPI002880ED0B|nr:DEAD/DEAH box helicase family protein [Exiguobacterium sp. BRG2]MDT0173077.1 DEAD/DEAH box helicase family protein [Exiguobacterium sp. BRG2]
MVNFKTRLNQKVIEKKVNPIEIYETLDRTSEKGPLRPIQTQILERWFTDFKDKKDVIMKLHTGQGKTITGLLMLQSKLNEDKGPALYLCHNHQLVDQACEQALSFGIKFVRMDNQEFPDEFIDSNAILITTVQKLFNGETKFKIGAKSLPVATILLDDAHACIEVIKNSFKITLPQGSHAYQEIFELFSDDIQNQGAGTFADIKRNSFDALSLIPYWRWKELHKEVSDILSKYSDNQNIKFSWPVLKDIIDECQCVISGKSLEIAPYKNPLHMFGSFFKASHRIFMSATITDDSFLIKGLGLNLEVIKNPLSIQNEKWSGEKMILIPSLIDESLTRTEMVKFFGQPREKNFGMVALVPGFEYTKDWKAYKSNIATKDSIVTDIGNLKEKKFDRTLVIANRYDGIDLPDSTCRVLIIDSKPYSSSLFDRYLESTVGNSIVANKKLTQTIEQGLGRAVRGEKDYCVIILIGSELVQAVRNREVRQNYSTQTKTQIELGLEIAEFAKEDIKQGKEPERALGELLNQSLTRDEGWKEFYTERMNEVGLIQPTHDTLNIFELERIAEEQYYNGEHQKAAKTIQTIIDSYVKTDEERGWYLQEMARYYYPFSKLESNRLQVIAQKKNRYLLKPIEGMEISKISSLSLKRIENICNWVRKFEDYNELSVEVDSILSKLKFGVSSDNFEQSLDQLAKMLGFESQRPDKEWKEGPDNLWKINDDTFLLIECKNNVKVDRDSINKEETGQMNNACAWFERVYGDRNRKNIIIISTRLISSAAGFNESVQIMKSNKLYALVGNVRRFYREFRAFELNDLSERTIQSLLEKYNLTVKDFLNDEYSEEPRRAMSKS